jgi:hypothetical protein
MMRLLMIYMLLGDCKHKFVFPSSTLLRNSSLHTEWLRSMTLFMMQITSMSLSTCSTLLLSSTLLLRTSIGLLLVSTFEDTRLGQRLIFAWNKTGINLVLVLVYVMMYMHGISTSGPLSGWYSLGSYVVSGMFFNTSRYQYCIPRL